MVGRVKSFNPSNRYGFITNDGVDYRFHRRDWNLRLPPVAGLEVEFTEVRTEKGMRAEDIKSKEKKHGE